ncbi:MAG TPA: MurR/RpiR family transcriptional regulator, partial [Bacillota bacterium]|nr:MurR/RpiR family transcriptional regulator [Bacillota bacterium]
AASLGSQTGLSESTVVRFALKLGFEGYPEMQRALQELTRTKLTSVQRMEVTNTLIGNADILAKMLLSDIDKIRRTLDEIDREVFYRAVDKIATARNIYIIGVRTSASLAGFLNFSLRMIFDNVRLIQTTSGSEIFEQLLSMEKEDVMIAISFPRYSKRIINAVAFARSRGAVVIALTDSAKSPIAGYADQLLTACSDMASFVDSLVAPLSIINAMIVALTRKKSDELKERLRELEKIWDEYDVYDKNS